MQEYHNDKSIKFEHTPVIEKEINPLNEVGATGSDTEATGYYAIDYTPTDLNTIYVSATDGDDDTGDGSEADPVATLTKADELCDTNDIHNVIIQDSEEYTLTSFTFTADGMNKIYAQKGETPKIVPVVSEVGSITNIKAQTYYVGTQYSGGIVAFSSDEVLLSYGTVNSLYIRKVDSTGTLGAYVSVAVGGTSYFQGHCAVTSKKYIPYFYYSTAANLYGGVLKSDMTGHVSGTLMITGQYPQRVKALSNDNVVLLSHNASGLYLSIVNGETLEAVTGTAVQVNTYNYSAAGGAPAAFIIEGDSNNIFVCCDDEIKEYTANGVYTDTYDVDFDVICFAEKLYNGNIMLGLYNDFKLYITIWSPVTQETIYTSGIIDSNSDPYVIVTTSAVSPSTLTSDGNVILTYTKEAASNPNFETKYVVISEDGEVLYQSAADFCKGTIRACAAMFGNNNYLFSYFLISDSKIYYQINKYTPLSIIAETDIELHGINLSSNDNHFLSELIKLDEANLKMRWCTVDNSESPYYWIKTYIATGTGNIELENTLVTDVDAGFDVTGEADVSRSQFIGVKKDYAIQLTDPTVATIIANCDFISNYGGIRLITNSGDEVIKNSILFRNSLASINADEDIAYDNCISSGNSIGVIPGTRVFNINPMYINDGTLNPALRDLNLRNRILGYAVDSPALYLGDDDENAGSLIIEYTGDDTTWTAITVDKDKQGITVQYIPVGEVKTERRDGSVSTYKDALTEEVTILWNAISNADWDKIYQMVKSASSRTRIYFQPVTSPLVYDEYALVYDKMSGSPKSSVALSRTGKRDVELVFQRAAE